MFLLKNLLIFLFVLFASNVSAKNFPIQTTPYISDYANLLDPETEARLTKTIMKLRQDLDLELTIATIETRYDYGNFDSIEECASIPPTGNPLPIPLAMHIMSGFILYF